MSDSPPASAHRAVFLSYASQDVEAAKRICESLRSAGLEVWFDQSELRGGDTWDQNIRNQIKTCALFLPVISQHTQERLEGYFRLEWRLADNRTHLMAKGRPFLLPIVVDGTSDAEARVPESFLEVQWTRLAGGENAEAFANRVSDLLASGAMASAPIPPVHGSPTAALPSARTRPRSRTLPVLVVLALGAAVALAIRLRPGQNSGTGAAIPASARVDSSSAGNSASPEKLPRALDLLETPGSSVEDFRVAEDLVRTELAKNPDQPDAVLAMARVCNSFINRGFDVSEDRLVQAQHYSEMSMQLAPGNPEAWAEMGQYLALSRTDLPRAEQLVRQAIKLVPDEPRYYRILDYNILRLGPDHSAAIKSAERTVARFPKDITSRYQLSLIYREFARFNEAEQAIRSTLDIGPMPGAEDWQVRFLIWRHGDFAGATEALSRVSFQDQANLRVALDYFITGCLSGQTAAIEKALEVVGRIRGSWIEDNSFTGPKAQLMGELYQAEGKTNAAAAQFSAAKAEVDHQEAINHTQAMLIAKCWTLLELGQKEEAQAGARAVAEESAPERAQFLFSMWWFSSTALQLLVNNRGAALKSIKELAALAGGRDYLQMAFKLDRRMAPFRTDPEIAAVLDGAPGKPIGPNSSHGQFPASN